MSTHTVHVRVTDAATGKPTPVRIRITDAEGNYYAPFGRLTEFATGPNQDVGGNLLWGVRSYAYIDGACEINLPAGPLHVEIHKGPEYQPLHADVTLGPGQIALRFTVERWVNMREEGWYSGDARCHFLTPHAALLEAQAEDVAVVNLLVTSCQIVDQFQKVVPALPNLLAFSGQQPALEAPGHLVVVNTHNSHPVLGSLGLLNCHRAVYPLTFGGPAGRDDWSLADWCGQCHRKGGLVVWSRTWHESASFRFGEPLADLLLGNVDAFEIDFFEDSPFDVLPDWYALLNVGCRVPLVGASGKDSNGIALGCMRTYAALPAGEALTYRGWIEAVRAGRTFATNGPLLTFTVDGQGPGAALDVAAASILHVRAEARSMVPFDHLEVIANGKVVTAVASGTGTTAMIEAEVPSGEGGWIAVRCRGAQQLPHRPAFQRVFAHTSPVYWRVEGRTPPVDAAAVRELTQALDQMLDWVQREARLDTDAQRERLANVFRCARQELLGRAGAGS